MKKITLLIFACLTILAACKKDDEANLSKKELLCAKTWKMTALTMQLNGQTFDLFAISDDCDKDDLLKFNTDGTTVMDYKVKCDVDDPQTETGKWVFNSDQTVITVDDTDTYTILELTSSVLKMTFNQDGYVVTVTFKPV